MFFEGTATCLFTTPDYRSHSPTSIRKDCGNQFFSRQETFTKNNLCHFQQKKSKKEHLGAEWAPDNNHGGVAVVGICPFSFLLSPSPQTLFRSPSNPYLKYK